MREQRAFLISISISLVAMYLVYQYIKTQDDALMRAYGTRYNITVAKRDIMQYETIRPTDVELLSVPAEVVDGKLGFIYSLEEVVESVAAVPISKGEFLLDNKIISKNIYSGLEKQISRERRAISIPVNLRSAVGFHLRPGSRVDLAAHFEYKSNGGNSSEVKVFLQDLLVLASGRTIQSEAPKAVDQQMVKEVSSVPLSDSTRPSETEVREAMNYAKTDSTYQTITLEVTPQQAQMIAFVHSVYGETLTVLLRHSDDRQLEQTPTTNLFSVMGPDSYLVKGGRQAPMRAAPRVKFYDYMGEEKVPGATQ